MNTSGPAALRDLMLGLLPFLLAVQGVAWLTFVPGALRGHADFRQLYAAAYMVRTGHATELYDYRTQQHFQDSLVASGDLALPFIRPAYQALLFVPFSLLSYRAAYLAFLCVNVTLLAVAFWLLRAKLTNLAAAWFLLPGLVFLVYYPTALALMQGQDSVLLLALLAAASCALERGDEAAGGALLAVGLFKLQIVIPIAVIFLLWRRWRFIGGFALSGLLLALVSIWTAGLAQSWLFLHSMLSVGGVAGNQVTFPLRVSIMANLRGLIFGLTSSRLSPAGVQTLIFLVSVAVLIVVAISVPRTLGPENRFMLAITTGVLVSYYLFIHDLSVMLIPIALVLNRYLGRQPPDIPLLRLTGWTAALLLVAPMCIFLMPGHFYLLALPLCAFMVMLILAARRECSPIAAAQQFSGELHG